MFHEFINYSMVANISYDNVHTNLNSPWFDDVATPDSMELWYDIYTKSLQDALAELQNLNREELGDWRWGRIHRLTMKHVFDAAPIIGKYFNIGPLEIGGSSATVNVAGYSYLRPYSTTWGASMRMIIDMADASRASFILPTGQSGHRFSNNYNDQTDDWLHGRYRTTTIDLEEIKLKKYNELILLP